MLSPSLFTVPASISGKTQMSRGEEGPAAYSLGIRAASGSQRTSARDLSGTPSDEWELR